MKMKKRKKKKMKKLKEKRNRIVERKIISKKEKLKYLFLIKFIIIYLFINYKKLINFNQ